MSNLALYRKYRPATFNDLIGQEMVVRILKEAAKQDRIAHAYLFAGPRGTGKTTSARLIAKIANCEHPKNDEPCNTCPTCKSIDSNTALDVIEIDAASNRGIDEMRNLKENVRTAPSALKYKTFIIDEAHQLTKEASNALLKTLEEPPEYVIIILATTELEKIPATIASRAQKFQFKHVPLKKIAEKLTYIAKQEKIKISPEALELIAAAGEGSFRDAESLLDQMMAIAGAEITTEEIERTTGAIGHKKVAELAGALLKNKSDNALELLQKINEEGHNIVSLTKDLIIYLRRTAVLVNNPNMKSRLERELTSDHLAQLESHSKLFKPLHLDLLKELIQAYSHMRYSSFPIIPLEIAIIERLSTRHPERSPSLAGASEGRSEGSHNTPHQPKKAPEG
jgi:DNA polymerase III subunit gamma/tau